MAEEAEQELDEGGGGGGGGGGIVKILIMVIPALLIGLGGGYFLGSSLTQAQQEETAKKDPDAEQEKTPKSEAEMVGDIFKLEPFVVNLNEPRGNRYLKATVQLEMDTPTLQAELERRTPQLRDVILQLLTSKTTQDLQAVDGKFKLREDVLSRINALLVNGSVTRVYFTEFVIQ
ncbi:MAG: flagellar basal body-associated FliL family protein [Magnetococcales bacterium]|nr:flagellar basal body-associated FliL family protein [Magnetococcales bacterium]